MSEQPATGPIPVSPQGPQSPTESVDQTVRLKAEEPAPAATGQTSPASTPASTHPFPQGAPTSATPQPSVSTQNLAPHFPDPTRTVTLGELPEVPAAGSYPAPPPVPKKRSGLWLGILVGAIVIVIIAAAVGFFGYRAGWFGERQAPPSYAVDEHPKPVVTPAIQPYIERAAAGDATAMQMLGYFYYYGLNVPQNRDEGVRWYRKAAAAGSVSAQKELAALEGKTNLQ